MGCTCVVCLLCIRCFFAAFLVHKKWQDVFKEKHTTRSTYDIRFNGFTLSGWACFFLLPQKKEEKEIRSQCVCPHGRCVLRRSVAPIILLLLLLLLSSSSHFASFHFSSPITMHANNISKTAAEGHTIFWSNRHTDLSLILFHSQTCFLFPFLSSRRAGFEFVVSFSNCLPLVFILRERF